MEYSFFRYQFSKLDAIVAPGNPEDPVIIFLHGYGSSADNLTFFPSACPFKDMRPTWIFPYGVEKLQSFSGGNAWFPLDEPLFQSLISNPDVTPTTERQYQKLFNVDFNKPKAALESLITEINRPHHDIILGGFSQGAMMTTQLILSSKIPYCGALICSGAMIFEKGWEENISVCGKSPFIQSHGYQDNILPYYHGEKLYSLLSRQLDGDFISFHGGHEIPTAVLQKIQKTIPLWKSR
ncbi:hypothetical protein BOKEGFJH_00305 [Chlamydia avium]|uniref:Phospholipase/Carboxylesterase family protein n=2 Tax=Chlamydia avium TaxID=1457141 RepID=W8JLP9_9CHLA|nr:phospholipase/carboxylesterase [Chlamydia avium]AHK63189.1 Phospholipase/Carboxylesterase family protein [Chlamydia avium 10DC88]EPP35878.1 phospholipase/Carboxylesterase family protein [Chlamydia psittaci 10_743_SC13]EPP38055.1 phospholipase/Carboxylesterase family protein [Chlamydia avium]VVT42793.1 hypothetical protein BOKEGFJH_00305 [Chlamydia avium]